MQKKILVLLWGNIRYDGRVQKEISSLKKFGYDVSLIVTAFDDDDNVNNYSYPIHIVKKNQPKFLLTRIYSKLLHKYKINKAIKEIAPDYIHCNDFAMLTYTIGWFNKAKVVYDAHELATEIYTGRTKRNIERLEKYAVGRCYKIIIPQIDRLNIFYFKHKEKIAKSKIYLLENLPLNQSGLSESYFTDKYGYNDVKKIISYVGSITNERGIEEVIEAISELENVVFFIIGTISTQYKTLLTNKIEKAGLANRVFIKPPIPNKEVLDAANSSNIGVVFYNHPNLNSYFCASNKLYEYINCGTLLLTNNIGGTARIIKNGINGYSVDDITVDEIRKAINILVSLKKPENKGNYYWENQEQILKEIYD